MNIMYIFLGIFTIVSVAHVIFISLKKDMLRKISKCLIIPPLLGAYIAGAGIEFLFPIPALILGWIGDVLLIKKEKRSHFKLGLAAFLLGHLCYIIAFIQILGFLDGAGGNINISAFVIFVPQALVLGMVIYRLIKPIKDMRIPVICYMVVLVVMGLFGFQAFFYNPSFAGLLIVSGCFNFMISDTLLAYYAFRKLKLYGAVLIMIFYILAQAEIIIGLIGIKSGALF